jgi:hypothetical protein
MQGLCCAVGVSVIFGAGWSGIFKPKKMSQAANLAILA